MNPTQQLWLIFTVLGGGHVLYSYAAGVQSPDRAGLLVGWPWAVLWPWIASAVLTALAFLYLQWYVVWWIDGEEIGVLLAVAHSLFLSSAQHWMMLSLASFKERAYRPWVSANLVVTAIASVLYAAALIGVDEESKLHYGLSVASGVVLVAQHVVWDAIVWNLDFHNVTALSTFGSKNSTRSFLIRRAISHKASTRIPS